MNKWLFLRTGCWIKNVLNMLIINNLWLNETAFSFANYKYSEGYEFNQVINTTVPAKCRYKEFIIHCGNYLQNAIRIFKIFKAINILTKYRNRSISILNSAYSRVSFFVTSSAFFKHRTVYFLLYTFIWKSSATNLSSLFLNS